MTDIKKTTKGKKAKKSKKLQLNKETLKDLRAKDPEKLIGGKEWYCRTSAMNDTCCWVARAVYGEDDPRWLLFREWLLGDAPGWFRGLYLRHGARFARWIAPHAVVKTLIRVWMDSVIDRKHGGVRLDALSAR